jgi:transcriptional regulator with GAF, ATPase, and Fis domain
VAFRDAHDALVVFADIARDLASQGSEQATLDRASELAVETIEGCSDAGILLVVRRRGVKTAAATSERVRQSDALQAQLHQGPCIDAAWVNRIYRSDDTATETRWPDYTPKARELGIESMMGLQLVQAEEVFGAMDFYGHRPHAFDADSERMAWVLASHAAVALNSARTGEQLQVAIETRQEIGEALGMLMQRYRISSDAAFAVLKRASQDHNIKLREVAQHLVHTGDLPGGP